MFERFSQVTVCCWTQLVATFRMFAVSQKWSAKSMFLFAQWCKFICQSQWWNSVVSLDIRCTDGFLAAYASGATWRNGIMWHFHLCTALPEKLPRLRTPDLLLLFWTTASDCELPLLSTPQNSWLAWDLGIIIDWSQLCLWAMCFLIDQSINQSTILVFRTHQGSQQTMTGKTIYT